MLHRKPQPLQVKHQAQWEKEQLQTKKDDKVPKVGVLKERKKK